jgi:ribonucleoside-triphosphate reductase
MVANYWLNKVYPKEIADAHKNCDYHIHDLSFYGGYCAGWSLRELLEEGLGGVPTKITSGPAHHLSTAIQQCVNFLGILQNEWAGAQAFSSFDTYLSPFIKKDSLSYKEVRQALQFFIYGINTPSRWGGQAPFSNITLDFVPPEDLKDKNPIIGGKKMTFTYADCQEEMNLFNKAFLTLFEEGDYIGNTFQYPIVTVNCTKEFFEKINPEVEELLYKITGKYGIPYFSNFIGNKDMEPSSTRSMCCRLRLDLSEIIRRGGGLFGAGEKTGSIGVVTLNLPRIGYLSKTEEEFFERLSYLMDLARKSLFIKRQEVQRNLDKGLYPYTKRYLSTLDNHFNTIGLVGMNECLLNFIKIKKDIGTKEGKQFAIKVLNFMRNKISEYQVEDKTILYNLESTPAESTAYRLALHDKQKFPDIITAGTIAAPYYTNSSNLPVGYTDDPWVAIKHQEDLQKIYSGGCVTLDTIIDLKD